MSESQDLHQCPVATCGYIYNPKRGDKKGKVEKGTGFQELPDDWVCPCCGAGKNKFQNMNQG